MAVKCNANNQNVNRTTNLPTISAYSAAGFAFVNAVNAAAFNILCDYIDQPGAAGWLSLGYDNTGTFFMTTQAGGNVTFATNPPLATWFFWAVTQSGTAATGYWAKVTDATLQSVTMTGNVPANFPSPRFAIGTDGFDGTEPMNAQIAWVKIWDRALTSAQLLNEKAIGRPYSQANINSWSPLISPGDVRDYSGNGRNFTANAGIVGATGPPLGLGDFGAF